MSIPSSELGPTPPPPIECVPPSPTKGGGTHSPAAEGVGQSQFWGLEKNLALCLLCGIYIRIQSSRFYLYCNKEPVPWDFWFWTVSDNPGLVYQSTYPGIPDVAKVSAVAIPSLLLSMSFLLLLFPTITIGTREKLFMPSSEKCYTIVRRSFWNYWKEKHINCSVVS